MSELIPTPVAPALDREELRERFTRVQSAYTTDRRIVMSVFQDEIRAATSPVADILQRTFGALIEVGREGGCIAKGASALMALTQKHAASRPDERELLIEGAKTAILELGDKGDPAARQLLREVGAESKKLVLVGAGQQMFFADLASQFGLVSKVPDAVRDELMVPLLDALMLALTLGAPVVRHDAMEGLGALLKHFGDEKKSKLKLPVIDADAVKKDGDPEVNEAYKHRCQRHELIVFAIAGDDDRRKEYFTKVRTPDGEAFHHRAEYLGALPAICRQAPNDLRAGMTAEAAQLLCEAAIIRPPVGVKPEIEATFARFQESVFRTIDAMLERRQVDARAFDVAIAAVVNAIPPTLVGPLDVCNAQTRATVAALSTAAMIAASLPQSNADAALKPLFESLGKGWKEWMNPGISEGCLRGLPLLLQDPEHVSWTEKALETLLMHLTRPVRGTNLAALHARLAATAAFRSLLVELAERLRRQQMQFESAEKYEVLARDVVYTIRHVLAHPTADEIESVFRKEPRLTTDPPGDMPRSYAEGIVAAVAFSTDVLNRSKMLFDGWERMTPAKQLLLVRILGLQLRSASHGRRELARCKVVNDALAGLAAVRVEEAERTKKLWQLLSDIPAEACVAADADLQEFVKYKNGTAGNKDDDDDLADYVLGMVSDNVSYQLAADIARQVDLNRHRAMLKDAPFDYAELLYQVMLRGPNIVIFDHLLARTPQPRERKLLNLLRDHVQTVQKAVAKEQEKEQENPIATGKTVIGELTSHAKDLIKKMEDFLEESPRPQRSPTLTNLANAMHQFVALGEPVSRIWEVMIGKPHEPRLKTVFASVGSEIGGLDRLFGRLDALAGDTHRRRQKLGELCADECLQLRQQVEKYLNLTVGAFGPSEDALHAASKIVDAIAEKLKNAGLEPPERHILLALIDSWRDMFRYTIVWWVDLPRRCVQAGRPDWYWKYVVNRPAPQPQHESFPSESSLRIEQPHEDAPQQVRYGRAEEAELAMPPEHTRPPVPSGHDGAIERFYVEWTAANLDVDHLRWALEERWDKGRVDRAVARPAPHRSGHAGFPHPALRIMDSLRHDQTHW